MSYEPTLEGARSIRSSENPNLARACVAFAFAYNRLDIACLAGNLAEDVVYGSQEALEGITTDTRGTALLITAYNWLYYDDTEPRGTFKSAEIG